MSVPLRPHQPFVSALSDVAATPATHGTGRFMTPLEALQLGLTERPTGCDARPPVGFIADQSLGSRRIIPIYGPLLPELVCGPTRAGKTTGLLLTAALSHPHGQLFLDVKEEIYHRSAGARIKMGRRPILLSLNATTPEGTEFYDPLQVLRIERHNPEGGLYEERDCWRLVSLMAEEETGGNNAEFRQWGQQRVAYALPHLLTAPLTTEEINDPSDPRVALVRERSLTELRRLLTLPPQGLQALAAEMRKSRRSSVQVAANAIEGALAGDGRMATGVSAFVGNLLQPWTLPQVRNMTYRPLEARPGSEPAPSSACFADLRDDADFYFGFPPMDLDLVRAVPRTLLGLAMDELTRTPPRPGKPAVHFQLDEYPQLGRLAPMETWVLFCAGYGIIPHFYAQSPSDLERNHPKAAHSFYANTNKVFFSVSDPDTADFVGRFLGQATVADGGHAVTVGRETNGSSSSGGQASFAHTGGRSWNAGSDRWGADSTNSANTSTLGTSWGETVGWGESRSWTETVGYTGRQVMTADEIMRMQPHESIVLLRGHRPMKLYRLPYHVFDDLRKLADLPPPRRVMFADFLERS